MDVAFVNLTGTGWPLEAICKKGVSAFVPEM